MPFPGGRYARGSAQIRTHRRFPVPELPEVEVVRRGLERWVAGRTVEAVEVLHPRAVRRHPGGGPDFAARLRGRPSEYRSGAGSTCGCPLRGGTCRCSDTWA